MSLTLPLARGRIDTLQSARETVDMKRLVTSGVSELEGRVTGTVSSVSVFLIEPEGDVALVSVGNGDVDGVLSPPGRPEPEPEQDAQASGCSDAATPFTNEHPSEEADRSDGCSCALEGGPTHETGQVGGEPEEPGAGVAGSLALWRPALEDALAYGDSALAPMLMGRTADGVVHVAVRVAQAFEIPGVHWAPLRWIGDLLGDDDSALALGALALVNWHGEASFCTRCGTKVNEAGAGWMTQCPGCGALEYPRQDPAVIVAVTDDEDRLLLAHNATWRTHHWSVLAGFVEAAESPERAVRREVLEEVGLDVDLIEYVATQPWPFPRSTMMGFRARLATGSPREPRPDGTEIDRARFFSRQDLLEAIDSGDVAPPAPTAIARTLVETWLGQPLPSLHQRGGEHRR